MLSDTIIEPGAENGGELITLAQLQSENREWAARNFPDRKVEHPLFGAIEELGELAMAHLQHENMHVRDAVTDPNLCLLLIAHYTGKIFHARLKTEQGIRGTADQHAAKAQEAVRTLGLLYGFYFAACGFPSPSPGDHIQSIAEIEDNPKAIDDVVDAIGDLLVFTADYSNLIGADMQRALDETWTTVRKRDWTKNRINGGALPEAA